MYKNAVVTRVLKLINAKKIIYSDFLKLCLL